MSFHGLTDPNRSGSSFSLLDNAIKSGGTAGKGPSSAASIWGEGGMFGEGGAASMVLGGLETLGTLWGAFQQNKLAKKQFKFQKKAYETNLANSTQVYNTALEDRIRARYATEGRSEQASAYIDQNRLGGGGGGGSSGYPTGRRINIEE